MPEWQDGRWQDGRMAGWQMAGWQDGRLQNGMALLGYCTLAHLKWCTINGGAHTCFIDVWISNTSKKHVWAPPLTEVLDPDYMLSLCIEYARYVQTEDLSSGPNTCTIERGQVSMEWIGLANIYTACYNWTMLRWTMLSVYKVMSCMCLSS